MQTNRKGPINPPSLYSSVHCLLFHPGLTERCQVAVLSAEQEQVNRHLLAGAVQSQLLVEVCRWG